jgi:hypothetical protein
MKILRVLVAVAAAALVVPWLIRVFASLGRDVRRYGQMRAMSDEKPMMEELPALSREIVAGEKQALRDARSSLDSVPADALRYMKIKAM